jgi:TM2 domain-containing membrane protein YozV
MKSFHFDSGKGFNSVEKSNKPFIVVLLLCFLFGWAGIHRFYVGKTLSGLLMLVTLGFFGIWVFIDFLMIAFGDFRDAEGKRIRY